MNVLSAIITDITTTERRCPYQPVQHGRFGTEEAYQRHLHLWHGPGTIAERFKTYRWEV